MDRPVVAPLFEPADPEVGLAVGAAVADEPRRRLHDPPPAERREHCVVERGRPRRVGGLDAKVIEHRPMLPAVGCQQRLNEAKAGYRLLHPQRRKETTVLVLGLILMLVGFLLAIPVLWTIGIILAIVGAILWIAEGAGATWGRRWY
jgi:hypothetical protein